MDISQRSLVLTLPGIEIEEAEPLPQAYLDDAYNVLQDRLLII